MIKQIKRVLNSKNSLPCLTISDLQAYYFLVVLLIITYKCKAFITRGEKTGAE
jgi:hypothetical protein